MDGISEISQSGNYEGLLARGEHDPCTPTPHKKSSEGAPESSMKESMRFSQTEKQRQAGASGAMPKVQGLKLSIPKGILHGFKAGPTSDVRANSGKRI